jgi:hypothetical protein
VWAHKAGLPRTTCQLPQWALPHSVGVLVASNLAVRPVPLHPDINEIWCSKRKRIKKTIECWGIDTLSQLIPKDSSRALYTSLLGPSCPCYPLGTCGNVWSCCLGLSQLGVECYLEDGAKDDAVPNSAQPPTMTSQLRLMLPTWQQWEVRSPGLGQTFHKIWNLLSALQLVNDPSWVWLHNPCSESNI